MNTTDILGISVMNLFIWIVFGTIIGFVAHKRDHRTAKGGIFATAIFAIVGSLVGGYLASFLLGKAMIAFSIIGLLMALGGAFLLAVFYRSSFRNNGYIKMLK